MTMTRYQFKQARNPRAVKLLAWCNLYIEPTEDEDDRTIRCLEAGEHVILLFWVKIKEWKVRRDVACVLSPQGLGYIYYFKFGEI